MESSDDGQAVSSPGPWEPALYKEATCKNAELTARGSGAGQSKLQSVSTVEARNLEEGSKSSQGLQVWAGGLQSLWRTY